MPFAPMLYRTARRITGRPDDANDLVQETFLRAYRTFANFQDGTNAKAWLFTIMYSIVSNQWRADRRAPVEVPVEELEGRFGVALTVRLRLRQTRSAVRIGGVRRCPGRECDLLLRAGSGSISGYKIGFDGELELLDADGRTAVTGGGPIDLALTDSGRFLYSVSNASYRLASAAMTFSSVSVIGNALRLRKVRL